MTPGGLAAVPLLPLFVPILSPDVQGEGKGKEPNQKEKRKAKKGMKAEEAAPGPVSVARTHLTAP